MIEEFNRHLGEFYSHAQFPCSAIFVHGEHYVLLYFQDQNRLTIYDTSTLPKSIESYGDLGSWCQEHSVMTSFAKIYKQLPGSTDCGPLSIANAIFLSSQPQISEQSVIDPESIANFMGSLDINQLQQVNFNYPPEIKERALKLKAEISQWLNEEEQCAHYPSNEQFLHPYICQELQKGIREDMIKRNLREYKAGSAPQRDQSPEVIPVQSSDIVNPDSQVRMNQDMYHERMMYTLATIFLGAGISWVAGSILPLVILGVISQAIYVTLLEKRYSQALNIQVVPRSSQEFQRPFGGEGINHFPKGQNYQLNFKHTP